MSEAVFELAGAELGWPIGSAPGLTNHPDIGVVANRLENLVASGVSFAVLGSWTLGESRGGNGYVKTDTGWEYLGGDEYVDLEKGAGYNAKALPGPGTDIGMEHLGDLVDIGAARDVEVALSVSPHSGQPLPELEEIVALVPKALAKGILYFEINLSCPNVPDRPPFYQDLTSLRTFYDFLVGQEPMLNKYSHLGVRLKYGPYPTQTVEPAVFGPQLSGTVGGRITSNTLANQVPLTPEGEPAIKVNNGKAGMSGPALRELGRAQVAYAKAAGGEVISVLGVDSGQEVKRRLELGANVVQLGSVLYWPKLVDCESAGEAIDKIKQEYVEAV